MTTSLPLSPCLQLLPQTRSRVYVCPWLLVVVFFLLLLRIRGDTHIQCGLGACITCVSSSIVRVCHCRPDSTPYQNNHTYRHTRGDDALLFILFPFLLSLSLLLLLLLLHLLVLFVYLSLSVQYIFSHHNSLLPDRFSFMTHTHTVSYVSP